MTRPGGHSAGSRCRSRFPGVLAGSLLVFIPLTGEYIIPVILGGNKTFYAGNLIAQQFLESRDWPLGSALAMVVIGAFDHRAPRLRESSRTTGTTLMTGRRLLGGYAVLAYIFLYAPIAVVVVFAFNGGREVLYWEGFSTKWFEARSEHPGDHERSQAQHPDRAR